jgi:hypothetical protein
MGLSKQEYTTFVCVFLAKYLAFLGHCLPREKSKREISLVSDELYLLLHHTRH